MVYINDEMEWNVDTLESNNLGRFLIVTIDNNKFFDRFEEKIRLLLLQRDWALRHVVRHKCYSWRNITQ